MIEMEERQFRTHSVVGVDIASLGEADRLRLADAIVAVSRSPEWWGIPGTPRYSLVRCFVHDNQHVCGWITQEHALQQHTYDELKHEESKSLGSFEDRFFVVHLNANLVTLEWRRFRGTPPLSLPSTVARLSEILSDILQRLGLPSPLGLEPIDLRTEKSEFLDLFYRYRVTEVEVQDFGSEEIPPDVELVNSVKHLEGAVRELVQHDRMRPSISKLVAEIKRDRNDADLRRSAIVRAAMHSGQPEQLRYEVAPGRHVLRRRVQTGSVRLQFPKGGAVLGELARGIGAMVVRAVQSLDMSHRAGTGAASGRAGAGALGQERQMELWDGREK